MPNVQKFFMNPLVYLMASLTVFSLNASVYDGGIPFLAPFIPWIMLVAAISGLIVLWRIYKGKSITSLA